jgi:hypothetical protein
MALIHPEQVDDPAARAEIKHLTAGYARPADYFVEKLSEGVSMIAAAFHPRPVIVRTSDFKTNEYAALIGGRAFERAEANPMLGFRGAARYAHPAYGEGFALECAAKVLAIVFPISAFGALGFEHSVANMYLIPIAWLAGAETITWAGLVGNLVPVSRSPGATACRRLRTTSLRSTTAPGAGPSSGASWRANVDLPVPETPPTATRRAGAGSR